MAEPVFCKACQHLRNAKNDYAGIIAPEWICAFVTPRVISRRNALEEYGQYVFVNALEKNEHNDCPDYMVKKSVLQSSFLGKLWDKTKGKKG